MFKRLSTSVSHLGPLTAVFLSSSLKCFLPVSWLHFVALSTAGTLHEFSPPPSCQQLSLPVVFPVEYLLRDPGLPQGCCQATRKLPVVFEEAGVARYHLGVVLTCGSSHCGRVPTTIDLSKSTVLLVDPHLPKGRPCENMTGTRCTNQVIAAPRLKSLLEHAGNAWNISHGSASDCDSLIAASEVMAVGPECLSVPCAGSLTHHPFHIAETQLGTFPFFTQSCWLTVRHACAPSNLGEGRNCTRNCHMHALTHLRHETHAKQNQQFERVFASSDVCSLTSHGSTRHCRHRKARIHRQ